MTEPLKLPKNPTPDDLATGLMQVHECLEAARNEVRQNTNALVVIRTQNELMTPVFAEMMKWSGRIGVGAVVVGAAALFGLRFSCSELNEPPGYDASVGGSRDASESRTDVSAHVSGSN